MDIEQKYPVGLNRGLNSQPLSHGSAPKLKCFWKVNRHPYLANKAVRCGVGGGAAIWTFKSTFSSSSFAMRLQKGKSEIV